MTLRLLGSLFQADWDLIMSLVLVCLHCIKTHGACVTHIEFWKWAVYIKTMICVSSYT
jgi:hypothetical protein